MGGFQVLQSVGLPKMHKKFATMHLPLPQGSKIDEGRRGDLILLIFGWVKYKRSRFIQGKAKNVTVSL